MATILIVDDYPANLMALEVVLEPLRQNIVSARSGRAALKLLDDMQVALILTDHRMRDLSGAELVQRVRNGGRNRSVPIILVSGSEGSEAAIVRATSFPDVLFVQKPYQADWLRAHVAQLIGADFVGPAGEWRAPPISAVLPNVPSERLIGRPRTARP